MFQTTYVQIQEWLAANPDPQTKGGIWLVKKLKRQLRNIKDEESE